MFCHLKINQVCDTLKAERMCLMFKRYVDVVVYLDKRGEIQPLFMKWENKTYKIEKTECMGMRNSHVGSTGVLYLCQINGKLRNLYYEKKSRWFVESSQP